MFFILSWNQSITACGVLKKGCLSPNITNSNTKSRNRRKSLTKYQIDSSEYVQPKIDETLMRSYTDYEKAMHNEYKLNIFSTVSSYLSSGTSPGQTDDEHEQFSTTTGDDESITIKTAQTKNDWIQEWAKNARRCNNMMSNTENVSPKLQHYPKSSYSLARKQNKDYNRIAQSYNTFDQFGDGLIENSSDECMAQRTDQTQIRKSAETSTLTKRRPPISPTKIPSPMNTQIRLRSSSANRSFRHSNIVSRKSIVMTVLETKIQQYFTISTSNICHHGILYWKEDAKIELIQSQWRI